MKRAQSQSREVIGELLNARLMTHRRVRVRRAAMRLRWIFPLIAMHVIEPFGFSVIGFHVFVVERPGRRNPAVMMDLAEVLFTQAKERGAVELGVAANVVIRVRMKLV